jgi:carbon monoxide dehydrogenase subunit G
MPDACPALVRPSPDPPLRIEGSHDILAPPDRVFDVLTDPECLRRVMPGCTKLQAIGPDEYDLALSAGVGPIRGDYAGTVRLSDVEAPLRYRMIVDVKGKTGFVKGEGVVTLTPVGEGTKVAYSGEVALGGAVASVGQRLHSSAAKMMTRQLFGAISAEATAAEGVAVKHGIIRDTLRGLRRRSL